MYSFSIQSQRPTALSSLSHYNFVNIRDKDEPHSKEDHPHTFTETVKENLASAAEKIKEKAMGTSKVPEPEQKSFAEAAVEKIRKQADGVKEKA